MTRTALLFSVFLLFAGHNAPGGGFIGGLVAGAALVLRFAAGGYERVASLARIPPVVLLGAGLVVASAVGVGGWWWGDAFLASGRTDLDAPVFGTLHLTSTLVFDLGVYLVVVGLVLNVLETLGGQEAA